jgi:hypothetical protein
MGDLMRADKTVSCFKKRFKEFSIGIEDR